jgi:hypothetical protein
LPYYLRNAKLFSSLAFPSLGCGGKRTPFAIPNRGNKRAKVFFQPRKSYTHDFCLLSDPNRCLTPSVKQLAKLKDAGLGRKRIVFPDKKAEFLKVKQVLETEYPKLTTQDGAFEFLRAEGGGCNRTLCLIPIPSDGYSISYLKDMVGPSTLIYIRPIKSAMSLEKFVNSSTSSPTTQCMKCKEMVPISNLRMHNITCNPVNIDGNESSDEDSNCVDEYWSQNGQINEGPSTSTMNATHRGTDYQDISPTCKEVVVLSDDGAGPSKATWSTELKDIFPDVEVAELEDAALLPASVDEAACFIMENQCNIQSLEDAVDLFIRKNSPGQSDDERLVIDRESIWMDIIRFYKKMLSKPDILKKDLCVSFKNEDGLDGGAMKVEFFTLSLQEVKQRLFEGKEENVIPIKDATKGVLFQIAGTIISQSVYLKASVGFPIVAPYVYEYIVGSPEEKIEFLMKKDLIPLDASTSLLHDLLTGLESCKTSADIDVLLEGNKSSEAFWQLINSSRWPKEQVITINNKDYLIQHLIHHELLVSRKNELNEFKEGMKSLGFLELVSKNKEVCEVLFCATAKKPLDSESFKDMILDVKPCNFAEEQSYKWLLHYMNKEEDQEFPGDSRCRSLLQFWSGWAFVPFGGLAKRLKIVFLDDDDKNSLPTASACTAILRLPTVHSSKSKFFEAMDIACKYGKVGFPNP